MSIVIREHKFTPKKGRSLSYRKKTTEVILHCTADPEGKDNTVEAIDTYHKNGRDFTMIGYHYVIYRDGSVHRGRPENATGGHCTNHNAVSVGVSYVGGMDKEYKHAKDTRTPEQCFAMYDLVHYLLGKYHLTINDVHCHREYAAKACPSFTIEQFRKEYKEYFG